MKFCSGIVLLSRCKGFVSGLQHGFSVIVQENWKLAHNPQIPSTEVFINNKALLWVESSKVVPSFFWLNQKTQVIFSRERGGSKAGRIQDVETTFAQGRRTSRYGYTLQHGWWPAVLFQQRQQRYSLAHRIRRAYWNIWWTYWCCVEHLCEPYAALFTFTHP